jgi:hypothetical protein
MSGEDLLLRRSQLFAAAVSVALVFGAAAPAMAKPGKANAKGHEKAAKPAKDPKAPKAPKVKGLRIGGGGISAGGAEFSVQARSDHPKKGQKGHFNYTQAATDTSPVVKIRCKSVSVALAPAGQAGDLAATVTGNCQEGSGKATQPVSVTATFYDNPAGDRADIVFVRNGVASPADSGAIVGDVEVR